MNLINKSTTDAFLKNISWIFITLGLLLIMLALWNKLDDDFAQVISKIGFTILTSGVFAAIMKSFQFIGIFKQEIENVILESKFIEKRNDLPDLWKKISRSIYNKKFPEISDELQEMILSSYFPTNHEYYYEDAVISINIEEFDKDENIKYTQSWKFKVVLAENVNSVTMSQNYTLDKGEDVSLSNNERLYYKIDGVDLIDKMIVCDTETDFKINRNYSLKVSDKKSFVLEIKERRSYCIKNDNIKLFRVNSITKEMDVSISFPDNIRVSFFNVGVIKTFEPKHIDNKNTISRIHKNGLILPSQGFGMSFVSK
jgi:hypothetical protein